ncbi:MAG: hypothetical protein M3Q97_07415 [Bacteroidota bacterium]|nr:hypothetical protein [Bacteroidota bacterium]
MKTIILVLSIFLGSLFMEATVTAAPAAAQTETTTTLSRDGDGKRFKTHKKKRRSKQTCMKKKGCKLKHSKKKSACKK